VSKYINETGFDIRIDIALNILEEDTYRENLFYSARADVVAPVGQVGEEIYLTCYHLTLFGIFLGKLF